MCMNVVSQIASLLLEHVFKGAFSCQRRYVCGNILFVFLYDLNALRLAEAL